MKFRRIFLLILAFIVVGTASAFADEAVEMYSGSKVKVIVNGKTLKAPGLLLNVDGESKTMLPTRDIADILQAMVQWDDKNQTVSIYKPNVHIALSTQNKDGSFGTFGTVYYQSKSDFFIFAQLDSLMTNIQALKFQIVDPYGDSVYESEHELQGEEEDMVWFRTPNINMEFKYLGKYKVKIFMKPETENKYFLVSEKVFQSRQK
jgi:hypothetical protein